MTPSTPTKVREWWIRIGVSSLPDIFEKEPDHITSAIKYGFKRKHKGEVIHVIEYFAFEAMRKERDEAQAKNAYLQKNYADAKADIKIALEQRERYKRALEYAKRCVTHNEDHAEIERILGVDAGAGAVNWRDE